MWSDNETSEDLLGFKVHADLLIEVINDETVLPVTIGVFGDWGSGKSSILKILYEELKSEKEDELKDNTLVLYFNGWVFEGYDDAKAALLESIIEKFQQHKKLGSIIKDESNKLLKSVNWMRLLGLGFKNIVLPATSAYLTGGVSLIPFLASKLSELGPETIKENLTPEKAQTFLSEIIKPVEAEEIKLVREFRDDFKKMLDKSEIKKLVVIIDDLDRCTHERIIENLEAIKLFLNVEKTAFIIGADPRIVRHAIEHRYKRESKPNVDSNERIIDDYLEKLIQIPYFLPKLSEPEVETYLSMLICKKELPNSEFEKIIAGFKAHKTKDRYSAYGISNFQDVLSIELVHKIKSNVITIPALVPLIAQSLYGNPRQIKRFLNTYTLRKRLANIASLNDFKDSVLAKLMILEYTELSLFTKLFEWQSMQNGIPKEISELEEISQNKSYNECKASFEEKGYKEWHKEKLIKWLNTEPKLSTIDLRDYFWISRDKITTSITGSSLISPIVRAVFKELENEIPAAVSRKIITTKVATFNEQERIAFLELCSDMIKKNPKTKRLYEIFHYSIDENVMDAAIYYRDSLKLISETDIEPATAVGMKQYKSHPDLGPFLTKYFTNGSSLAAKAFNLKDK